MRYLIVLVVLFLAELLYFKVADYFNIIDKPNERSSHTQITLRGGGVIFYFGALLFFILSEFQYPYFFIGLTLITVISFLDDVFTLSNKIRIFIHFFSILLMLYQVGILQQPFWIIGIALILCVGIINAYNFMDGINGITVSNSLAVLLLLAIVNHQVYFVSQDLIIYSMIASVVFGFFNFRQKAKCFAGDVGSVSMAFIILFLLTKLILQTENPIYILFLSVYGIDSIWTIFRRLLKKENIFQAHRTHLYQILANENQTNKLLVSGLYGIIQLILGFIIIYSTTTQSSYIQWLVSVAIIVGGTLLYFIIKNRLLRKYQIQ